jgi:hypothetical protein
MFDHFVRTAPRTLTVSPAIAAIVMAVCAAFFYVQVRFPPTELHGLRDYCLSHSMNSPRIVLKRPGSWHEKTRLPDVVASSNSNKPHAPCGFAGSRPLRLPFVKSLLSANRTCKSSPNVNRVGVKPGMAMHDPRFAITSFMVTASPLFCIQTLPSPFSRMIN